MIVRIPDFPDFSEDEENKLRVIGHAVNSFGEGKNVLWMPKSLVRYLIQENCLGPYVQRVLSKLNEFVRGAKSFHENFLFHLEVSFEDKDALNCVDGKKIVVGYRRLLDSSFWQKSRFVVENTDDSDIYYYGAIFNLIHKGLYGQHDIRFACYHGGGATTFDQFVRLLNDGNPVLCVLDSDKSHPEGSIGGTAKRFNGYSKGLNELYFLEVLNCREIENIIPKEIVCKSIPHERRSCLARFEYLDDKGFRDFFDHKKGLKIEDALNIDARVGESYWTGLVSEFEGEVWVCEGISENIARHCYNTMAECSPHKSYKLFNLDENKEWRWLSEVVAAWGVCIKRVTR
ncbi:hypothetical protein [Billgrantia gudaonensis]|uniref:Uncharacterized protein n=1 Tax=Billgrantia gudaonensis TaxID=376427 RepID=A0A1G9DTM1_9GAMM|nr:hypothetical protein [Halomonas gudaonensis]SDK67184.1 hypothetical protein SAMN04487954_1235 [Halomonas gudaonensis]